MLTKDGFAATLLTISLLPDREEYARPYSVQEYYRLERRIRESSAYRSIGDLLEQDIGALMMYLDVTEEEGYRIYTLLNRSVQLSYAIDDCAAHNTEVVSLYGDYPDRLIRKLRDQAPVMLYRAGNAALLDRPAFGILGIQGVKTPAEVRDGVKGIVRDAVKKGYAIITGGELGVSRVAANAVLECGGCLVDVLGGMMFEHMENETISALMAENRALVISLIHPKAMYTVSHAIARSKVIFALSDAALVCNTDNKRGEIDAIHNSYCDWIYAWSGCPQNATLISRGAAEVDDLRKFDFENRCAYWKSAHAEQITMFDLL